jgi:peptide/nickel transport system substrate-binding protein
MARNSRRVNAGDKGLTRRGFLELSAGGLAGLASLNALPAWAGAPVGAEESKLGRHLIGKLEGPEILMDPTKIPKKFSEAPVLSQLVKIGKLPPVEQRLPAEPMVVKPLREIGKYGGTWRRAFTGPADVENGNRICSTDKPLFVDYTGTVTKPCVAKAWKMSDDGKVFTLTFRKGMKWSDGAPFSVDDVMFWYEDIYLNKELLPIPPIELTVNGKVGRIEKVDDYTIAFVFPEPYYLFETILRGDGQLGCGQATGGTFKVGNVMGLYAPRHYLKNYLPKYVSQDQLAKQVRDAKMDSWTSLFRFKYNWALNTDLPVLTPWKTVTPNNTPQWILERNPYYFAVDTEGNQLPYWDKIVMTLAETLETLNLRAIAGEYDWQSRHIQVPKLPVFLENQKKGNYKVYLDPGQFGGSAYIAVNLTYEADAEIAKWLRNVDFRRALSLGIERDQINEVFFLGLGTPGSTALDESLPHSPGPQYRTLWSTFDPKKANEMLDKIGLSGKDSEGYRLRTDGKGRLRIEVATQAAAFINFTGMAEMAVDSWKKIGIQGIVKEMERGLQQTRSQNNELQMEVSENTGSENLWVNPGHVLPVLFTARMGPLYYKWYATGGKQGKKPEDPRLLRALEIFSTGPGLKETEERAAAQEIWRIVLDLAYNIGLVGLAPGSYGVRIVKNNVGNVPGRLSQLRDARIPCGAHPATLFFKS